MADELYVWNQSIEAVGWPGGWLGLSLLQRSQKLSFERNGCGNL